MHAGAVLFLVQVPGGGDTSFADATTRKLGMGVSDKSIGVLAFLKLDRDDGACELRGLAV